MNFQARLAAGDPSVHPDELAQVEEYAVRHGERWYEGMLHHYRGVAAFATGDVAEAQSRSERALEAFAASGDLWGIVNASEILGHSLAAVGEYDRAGACVRARARRGRARPAARRRCRSSITTACRGCAPAISRRGEPVRRVRAARRA